MKKAIKSPTLCRRGAQETKTWLPFTPTAALPWFWRKLGILKAGADARDSRRQLSSRAFD
jgi:hypothetical protein